MTSRTAPGMLVTAGVIVVVFLSAGGDAHPTGAVKWSTVSRVLAERCISCHSEAGTTPPALDGYENARRAAGAIKQAVLERRMPPWYAVEGFGDFARDPTLTPTEIGWLADWADAGAPDDQNNAIAATVAREGGSHRPAEPDLVLQGPPHRIEDPSHTFALPTGLVRDRWIRGWEVRPGNQSSVLSAVMSIAPNTPFGSWTAGEGPILLPEGIAKRLPTASTILLTVRYRRMSHAAIDQSSVGFFFSDPPRRELRTRRLPCGASVIPRDVDAVGVRVSGELSGEALSVIARRPDGSIEPLGWFRNYPRAHDRTYWFRRRATLAAKTSISVDASNAHCGAELEYVSP